jgi:hypothetical protein
VRAGVEGREFGFDLGEDGDDFWVSGFQVKWMARESRW